MKNLLVLYEEDAVFSLIVFYLCDDSLRILGKTNRVESLSLKLFK